MRRIIQSARTGEYFREGAWTPNLTEAQHFPDSGKVIETCMRYHLSNVELVLQLSPETPGICDTRVRLFDFSTSA